LLDEPTEWSHNGIVVGYRFDGRIDDSSAKHERRYAMTFTLRLFGLAVCCSLVSLGCLGTTVESELKTESKSETDQVPDEDETTAPVVSAGQPGQVLRHAVFFGFQEGSTDEQVTEVVDAFRALPSKIAAITDFGWGVNNSPEEHDDGYTHCFLLTFKDNAGRETYLPHPDHKAFGATLGPIRDKVFVMDYWGTPAETPVTTPLRHAVFFKFKDDASAADIKAVEDAFAELPAKIDSIKEFEWGLNNSSEGKDEGFTHCFMVTFESEAGRAAYLPHPEHAAFVKILLPVLDKVRVLDFQAEK
jgi:hypothetical protein